MNLNLAALDPVAIQLGGLSIRWYGVIIATAVVVALLIALQEATKRNVDKELLVDLLIWAIPIAIISARIYYVLFEWSYYKDHLNEVIKIWQGGIAIHGALIGSVLTAIIFSRIKKSFVLAVSRYCCTESDYCSGDWALGQFYESRGSRWTDDTCFFRRIAFAGLYY